MKFPVIASLFLPFVSVFADAPNAAASASAVVELRAWLKVTFKESPTDVLPIGAPFASVPLTKADAAAAKRALWEDHVARIKAHRAEEMKAKVIEYNGKKMKFETLDFPSPKDQPRSLFISMHGGGNAPPAVNESQYKNQIALGKAYKPAEGIYVAPRAPTDTWNLWHEGHIDVMFDRLIQNMIVLENVDPNRVYIMGYSAGGDGVYQLAPRMSDRLAAAAMMAGHPNETVPEGLRNVPFALQVGINDAGFKRNEIASTWGVKLDALHEADPKGYEHFTELHAGKGHWMDLQDRKAVPWMEKFTRNPLPEKIVWVQDDVTHDRLYWLAVPEGQVAAKQQITAERAGQKISLTCKEIPEVIVMFNDAMVNLDQPVEITAGEKKLFQGPAARTIGTLARTLKERGDLDLTFSSEVKVKLTNGQ